MTTNDAVTTRESYDATVTTPWEAIYSNVVAAQAGERVEATARQADWRENPGWIWRWCRDSHGREGWVPEALLMVVNEGEATLSEDYDASELTVAAGTRVTVEREMAGWALCHTTDQTTPARGWVPLECLARQ
jgi:hypothetical protein